MPKLSPAKLCVVALLLVVMSGCTKTTFQINKPKPLPEESLLAALRCTDPDERYQGLTELSESPALTEDWAVRALVVIARTDSNAIVRRYALHCLGQVADTRVVEQVIESLKDPDVRVRVQAATLLDRFDAAILEQAKLHDAAGLALVAALSADKHGDVRMTSAAALADFHTDKALYALIAALNDRNFAVRYQAERSLVALTGKTFHGDASAWIKWTKTTTTPFADAGQIPPELQEPDRNLFQKTYDKLHQNYLDWQGEAQQ